MLALYRGMLGLVHVSAPGLQAVDSQTRDRPQARGAGTTVISYKEFDAPRYKPWFKTTEDIWCWVWKQLMTGFNLVPSTCPIPLLQSPSGLGPRDCAMALESTRRQRACR